MRVAILGVSTIAEISASAMKKVGISLEAVLSRDINKAMDFKNRLGVNKAYNDYEDLLDDQDIDTVYVGLPNSLHYDYAAKALMANKNVLLEKPFTMDYKEAIALKNLAISRHLYLFETVVTLYQPLLGNLHKDLKKIGPVHLAILNFSKYSRKYDEFLEGKKPNIFNPNMGGGALNDLNIYNLHLIYDLFGRPKGGRYEGNMASGIDTSGIINLRYPNMRAVLVAGKDSDAESFGMFMGEKGYIKIHGAPSILAKYEYVDHEGNKLEYSNDSNRYENEFAVMRAIIEKDEYKTHLNLLNRSLEVMKLLDDIKSNAYL